MAKKKASIGIITWEREKPRKIPGRHAKSYSSVSLKENDTKDKDDDTMGKICF